MQASQRWCQLPEEAALPGRARFLAGHAQQRKWQCMGAEVAHALAVLAQPDSLQFPEGPLTNSQHQQLCRPCLPRRRCQVPDPRCFVECCARDAGAELEVGCQVKLVRHPLLVAPNLRLRAKLLRPVGVLGKGVAVDRRLYIASAAWARGMGGGGECVLQLLGGSSAPSGPHAARINPAHGPSNAYACCLDSRGDAPGTRDVRFIHALRLLCWLQAVHQRLRTCLGRCCPSRSLQCRWPHQKW